MFLSHKNPDRSDLVECGSVFMGLGRQDGHSQCLGRLGARGSGAATRDYLCSWCIVIVLFCSDGLNFGYAFVNFFGPNPNQNWGRGKTQLATWEGGAVGANLDRNPDMGSRGRANGEEGNWVGTWRGGQNPARDLVGGGG
ncbi:hypothetical protein TIFTF001_004004 [Ficus carica]|uniref:Uncharacterized protein n=1 Tax=Ficus carica TaxID=3494 RepID=A0AA87ZA65_FICCA|nr:hypothetical protein TIFTF001_004004 [Ficus carica]